MEPEIEGEQNSYQSEPPPMNQNHISDSQQEEDIACQETCTASQSGSADIVVDPGTHIRFDLPAQHVITEIVLTILPDMSAVLKVDFGIASASASTSSFSSAVTPIPTIAVSRASDTRMSTQSVVAPADYSTENLFRGDSQKSTSSNRVFGRNAFYTVPSNAHTRFASTSNGGTFAQSGAPVVQNGLSASDGLLKPVFGGTPTVGAGSVLGSTESQTTFSQPLTNSSLSFPFGGDGIVSASASTLRQSSLTDSASHSFSSAVTPMQTTTVTRASDTSMSTQSVVAKADYSSESLFRGHSLKSTSSNRVFGRNPFYTVPSNVHTRFASTSNGGTFAQSGAPVIQNGNKASDGLLKPVFGGTPTVGAGSVLGSTESQTTFSQPLTNSSLSFPFGGDGIVSASASTSRQSSLTNSASHSFSSAVTPMQTTAVTRASDTSMSTQSIVAAADNFTESLFRGGSLKSTSSNRVFGRNPFYTVPSNVHTRFASTSNGGTFAQSGAPVIQNGNKASDGLLKPVFGGTPTVGAGSVLGSTESQTTFPQPLKNSSLPFPFGGDGIAGASASTSNGGTFAQSDFVCRGTQVFENPESTFDGFGTGKTVAFTPSSQETNLIKSLSFANAEPSYDN